MLPLTRHKTPMIPHGLAAVAAVLCLALTFAPAPRGDNLGTLPVFGTQMADAGHTPVDAEPAGAGADGPAERERRSEAGKELKLPNFTFFLFPPQQ